MADSRVTLDPAKMGGAPCIRGLRIRLATIVAMLADGMSREAVLAAYPDLEPGEVDEANSWR